MQSTTSNRFAQIPSANIQRSTFNRSHGHKTTFDSGYLIPVFHDMTVPGDTYKMRANMFARMATPIYPLMDNVFLDVFWFDVPLRLIFDNFQKMMGEQDNPGDSIDFIFPTMTHASGGYSAQSLSDYLGIPTLVNNITHHSLVHRAYNLIYNEWFRDQNLQDSVVVDKDDGPDAYADYALLKRGKRFDYFSGSLPWPQKGDAISMPLGDRADVKGIGFSSSHTRASSSQSFFETGETTPTTANGWVDTEVPTGAGMGRLFAQEETGNYPDIYADLSTATAATITAMRTSVALQQFLETDARGGTRYKNIIKSHFNVVSPDARLDRPEFLGGTSVPVNISPIAQTSSTDATSPQGNLSAMATATVNGNGFTKSFVEHSIVMGIVSVRADLSYQQGLNRQFSYSTRYDLYWPGFQNLSEQSVLNKEIYSDGSANDDLVFGYQERYAELKYKPSIISGKMRSNATGTLEAWHLAQDFASLPVLGDTFIKESPPIDRVVAVPSEPEFIFDSYFDLKCVRPMQLFSQPGLTRF